MNLASSFKSFFRVLKEDHLLHQLGAPRGWLLRLHYEGRWAARYSQTPPLKSIMLTVEKRKINLTLSAAYEGAFKGIFLDEEYNCLTLLLKPPLRILDLGANIGMGSIFLSTLFPNAQFTCVEPDPRNLPLLTENLASNNIQASIYASAIGATPGNLELRFGSDPTCSALENSPMHSLDFKTTVVVKTVENVLSEVGWDHVDLLKIDIEGSEDELLSKNNSWLEKINAIILEIHPNTTSEYIASYLKPYGFNLRRIGWKTEPVYFASREHLM